MSGTEQGRQMRQKMLQYIISYMQLHGYSPSIREIQEAVGLKSPGNVNEHLRRMLAEGVIETDAGVGSPRAIRVPGYKYVKVEDENGKIQIYEPSG